MPESEPSLVTPELSEPTQGVKRKQPEQPEPTQGSKQFNERFQFYGQQGGRPKLRQFELAMPHAAYPRKQLSTPPSLPS